MVAGAHISGGQAENVLVRVGCPVRLPHRVSIHWKVVASSVAKPGAQLVLARGVWPVVRGL